MILTSECIPEALRLDASVAFTFFGCGGALLKSPMLENDGVLAVPRLVEDQPSDELGCLL